MAVKLKIKEIAEAQNLDAAKLSRTSGLAYATVHRLWYGPLGDQEHDKGPGVFVLKKIANALGVKVVDLIEEDRASLYAAAT